MGGPAIPWSCYAAFRLRRQESRSRAEWITVTAGNVVVALVVIVPLVAVASRIDAASLSVLLRGRAWILLARSLCLASAVTLGALAIGVPCGAVFARARMPGRGVLFALHVAPVFLPPFFGALGWFHLLVALGGVRKGSASPLFFGPVGAWAVLVVAFAPIVTALSTIGIRALDPSLEEAARLVAGPGRVVTRILVPAARRHVAIAALVVFTLSLGELGVPMFLRVDVYPAAVFARLGGLSFAPGEAAVLAAPIVAIAALLVLAEARLLDPRGAVSLGLRTPSDVPLDLGPGAPCVAIVAAALSAMPLLAIGVKGASAVGGVRAWMGSSVSNGLVACVIAATAAVLVAVPLGHALARDRGGRFADLLLLFAFFAPSAVLGVGITTAWNRPATGFVYGSGAVLVLALLARYGVLAVRVVAAAVADRPAAYEEAAAALGSGYLGRLFRIVAPMERRGLVAAFGLTAVFCLRDLETAVLVYPPGGEPLTVRIFTLEANGPPSVVAALALVHVAVTTAVVFFVASLYERSRT